MICSGVAGDGRGWSLPDGMADLSGAPLYVTVAVWGLRLKRFITTDDVARNFCITQQQARDVLHYIGHEGARWVESERRVIIRDARGRQTGLLIRAVTMPEPADIRPRRRHPQIPPRSEMPPSGQTPVADRHAQIKTLRAWMVNRRPGEPVPEDLLRTQTNDAPLTTVSLVSGASLVWSLPLLSYITGAGRISKWAAYYHKRDRLLDDLRS
ncbi:CaiF/GrlA family transcriptional regulator [Salmonella enterica]